MLFALTPLKRNIFVTPSITSLFHITILQSSNISNVYPPNLSLAPNVWSSQTLVVAPETPCSLAPLFSLRQAYESA